MIYQVGDQVSFQMKRCACVGGGMTEMQGQIIGTAPDVHGIWYQVNTSIGVFYVRECDMLS